jgi:hypothetical protein
VNDDTDEFFRSRHYKPDEGVGPQREASPPRFVLARFADFKPLHGDDYCVKGVLPRSGLAVFWGPPKCGKSFLVFDLLLMSRSAGTIAAIA